MQAVSLGWSCPPSPGIAPVLTDQVGAGALSRPARRRPELTARAAARAVSPVHYRAGPVLRRGARRRGAGAAPGAPIGAWRRAGPARPGAWGAAVGGRLMALPV